MDSPKINSRKKYDEKNNRNRRNPKSNNKDNQKQQKNEEKNIIQSSERLNKKNNFEEYNSNSENNNSNSENNNLSESNNKKPIYVMSLELEDGNLAKIKIYSDSNPELLAKEFCKKNNLEPEAAEYLSNQIEMLIEQYNNEENNENENNEDFNGQNEEIKKI